MKMRSIAPMKIAKIGYIVVSGTIVLFHPKNVMAFISTAFGIKDWWLILSLAIIAGIMGVALIFGSAFGAGVLTILIGVSFLSEGILNLYTVIRTVLIVKNQVPDFVETDTFEFFEKDR